MLRTCTPGPAPHLRSPSPSEGIRQQIVDMVRITDGPRDIHRSAAIIYDLRHRQVLQRETTPAKHPDIRRLPSRARREEPFEELNTSKSSSSFPVPVPCQTSTPNVTRKEWRRTGNVRKPSPIRSKSSFHAPSPPQTSKASPEKTKRPRTGQGRSLQKTKTIRVHQDSSPGPHCHCSESSSPSDEKTVSKTSAEPCQVRGNAINSSSPTRPRIMSPVKRAEVQRRASLFSASLELFRRRLKMNQHKFFSCKKVDTDDYVIRKDEERKTSAKQRISVNLHPSPPKTPTGRNNKVVEESLADDTSPPPKYTYRLPEVHEDEASWSDLRGLPQVHTYVLEDHHTEQRMRNFKEPAPLTSHNLNIHNMFMEQQRRRPRVESNGVIYDARVWRWVEESNAHSRVQRVVRFNISPSAERVSISDTSSRIMSSSERS